MCLLQGGAQGLDFVAVALPELVDLAGEGEYDGVGAVGALLPCRAGPVAEVLDAPT